MTFIRNSRVPAFCIHTQYLGRKCVKDFLLWLSFCRNQQVQSNVLISFHRSSFH